MAKAKLSPSTVAKEIRQVLQEGGSADHAQGVQWFFKEEIKSHGWYTAELREAKRAVSDEHSEAGAPFGAAHGVRNAADGDEEADPHERLGRVRIFAPRRTLSLTKVSSRGVS